METIVGVALFLVFLPFILLVLARLVEMIRLGWSEVVDALK